MSIRIIKNGVMDTLQDLGRHGYAHLGINPGGAMDHVAMQVANILVGNHPATAVIEMHIPAAEILFEENALIALAGADVMSFVNGEPVSLLHPLIIKKGATLSFGKRNKGARIYLAVKDGFVIDSWLNSYSTNTKAEAGGFKGRALQKNDCIPFTKMYQLSFSDNICCKVLPWFANLSELYTTQPIRFIPGNEYYLLAEQAKHKLETNRCIISSKSDRMGFRLQTEVIRLKEEKELISTAVTRGTIQLLPEGQMIILMADHQTTGGYPVIGHVISADLPSLAQLQTGESFLLQQTTMAVAEDSLFRQQKNLKQLQYACEFGLANRLPMLFLKHIEAEQR